MLPGLVYRLGSVPPDGARAADRTRPVSRLRRITPEGPAPPPRPDHPATIRKRNEQAMTTTAARHGQARRYVENRHIDHIPAGARHGKPWHQFAFWFGINVCVLNIVVGAVTVSIGLTFEQALIAIAVGTVIGALLIALHATQGPRLGVPQTIQSRGQSGFYGAAFMFPAVLLIPTY